MNEAYNWEVCFIRDLVKMESLTLHRVSLSVLKLFAQKDVFNYVKEKYGQKILAKMCGFERQRIKLAKTELDIAIGFFRYTMHCQLLSMLSLYHCQLLSMLSLYHCQLLSMVVGQRPNVSNHCILHTKTG